MMIGLAVQTAVALVGVIILVAWMVVVSIEAEEEDKQGQEDEST